MGVRFAPVPVRPTFAQIDADALMHNLRALAERTSHGQVLAVVKADGYGHGAVRAGRAFIEAGAWGLAVALLEEAVELREAGVLEPILVLGGVYPGYEDLALRHDLSMVVWEPEQCERLAAARRRPGGRAARVHLKLDSGMGRLGVRPEAFQAMLERADLREATDGKLEGILTHLACADDEEDPVSEGQLDLFERACEQLSQAGFEATRRHAANSAGTLRYARSHYDLVRPGLALYGVSPTPGAASDLALRPAMRVISRIAGLRTMPAGQGISYGHLTHLRRETRVAIVPFGYEDGFPRRASAHAQVLIQGRRCRVLGAITMDTTLVDVTDLEVVRVGEPVVLLGDDPSHATAQPITVAELARWSGLILHEVLCGISPRVPRT